MNLDHFTLVLALALGFGLAFLLRRQVPSNEWINWVAMAAIVGLAAVFSPWINDWIFEKEARQTCHAIVDTAGQRAYPVLKYGPGQTMESCSDLVKKNNRPFYTLGCLRKGSQAPIYNPGGASPDDFSPEAVDQTFPYPNCGWVARTAKTSQSK